MLKADEPSTYIARLLCWMQVPCVQNHQVARECMDADSALHFDQH